MGSSTLVARYMPRKQRSMAIVGVMATRVTTDKATRNILNCEITFNKI